METEEEVRDIEIIPDPGDESCVTFVIRNEDHTLGNVVRYMLVKNKDVDFAGYTIPHPMDNIMNLRVQTVKQPGKPVSATSALLESLDLLTVTCEHIIEKFEREVTNFEEANPT